MNGRWGRRALRTWLAIQARTYASTSGDLRMLAQFLASNNRSVSRNTMGDRLIAASNAYRRAPADNSEPVVMALSRPVAGTFLMRNALTTLSALKGFLTPLH
jgi:hypothetical protein